MSTCMVRLRVAGILLLVGLIAFLSAAQSAPVASDPDARARQESPAEKIRKGLDQNVTLDYAGLPLNQAIQNLREQTKLNIVLDRMSIQNMGIMPDESPVTLKARDVKLRSGLRTLLAQYNLGFVIVNDMLLITTDEMALYRQTSQRVSIELTEVPLKIALKQLAKETATNLVLDGRAAKEAQTPITLSLEDVPLETAVKLMAELANLKPARIGNVVFVTTEARADKLRSDPENGGGGPYAPAGGLGGPYYPRSATAPPLRIEDVVVPQPVAPPAPPRRPEEKEK